MEKTSTMKDVARLAGVSVGTVSRVINNEAGIKESTLEKVASAIEALHYIPDAYARGMKTSKQACSHIFLLGYQKILRRENLLFA